MTGQGQGPFFFDPLPESTRDAGEPGTEGGESPSTDGAAFAAGMAPRPQQVLFEEPAGEEAETVADRGRSSRRRKPRDSGRVPALARLTSGLLDLAAMMAALLLALLGAGLLGIRPRPGLLPGIVLFVVTFSFVYFVFSLLFWGRTPGMASSHLVTRDPSGQTLTAWQSTLRWTGSLGTVILAGIPMIVSWFTGWSLADLVSGSETRAEPG